MSRFGHFGATQAQQANGARRGGGALADVTDVS